MAFLDFRGKKGLVVGIADEESLAAWAAKHFNAAGAGLVITYFNDKAKPLVEPIAQRMEAFCSCLATSPWPDKLKQCLTLLTSTGQTRFRASRYRICPQG